MTRDLYRVSLAAALIGCGDNGGKLETTGSMPDPQTVTSEGAGHEATGAPTTGMMGETGETGETGKTSTSSTGGVDPGSTGPGTGAVLEPVGVLRRDLLDDRVTIGRRVGEHGLRRTARLAGTRPGVGGARGGGAGVAGVRGGRGAREVRRYRCMYIAAVSAPGGARECGAALAWQPGAVVARVRAVCLPGALAGATPGRARS